MFFEREKNTTQQKAAEVLNNRGVLSANWQAHHQGGVLAQVIWHQMWMNSNRTNLVSREFTRQTGLTVNMSVSQMVGGPAVISIYISHLNDISRIAALDVPRLTAQPVA